MDKVAIIGGGFVGLQEAVLFATHGFKVYVIDVSKDVVERINAGDPGRLHIKENYIVENWGKIKGNVEATTDYRILSDESIRNIVIAVNTPVKVYGKQLVKLLESNNRNIDDYIDFRYLSSAVENIANNVNGRFYINSLTTIYPGGTEEKIARRLIEKGFAIDKDFYITHTPERVDPGSKKYNAGNIPRVIGGLTKDSLKYGISLYEKTGLRLIPVNSIRIAEASKIFENAWRFINIAISQELYSSVDNAIEIIEASSTKPFGFMKFYPGPYIGGSCLLKDTIMYYCTTGSKLAKTALIINEDFPKVYARKLNRIIEEKRARKILFVGLGFKPHAPYYVSKQLNPVERVIEELIEINRNIEVRRFDPLIPDKSDFSDMNEALKWSDIVFYWEKYQLIVKRNDYV